MHAQYQTFALRRLFVVALVVWKAWHMFSTSKHFQYLHKLLKCT